MRETGHGEKETGRWGEEISGRPSSSSRRRRRLAALSHCSACGTEVRREFAKFCRVCGKTLGEDYEPLDALRASYRLQGKTFQFDSKPVRETVNLFEEDKNSASSTAWAFVVYSLVPYLGILFCPGAILMGGIGIYVSYRKPYLGGGRAGAYSIALSLIIFAVQILLWWLLYLIPELGK